MRYINRLFTYLLTYLLEGLDPSWAHATALAVTPVIIIIIIKWHARAGLQEAVTL